jgi:two-component sensor histidine kinase
MRAPSSPRETERIAALYDYDVLDTPAEADFDEVVQMVARMCDVPMALISLVDSHRQWFKAACGTDACGTPVEHAICAHAILHDGVMVVPDTLADPRFSDNPLCTGDLNVRFYAGAPLVTRDGLALGTVCVLDHRPRDLTVEQINLLRVTADLVMRLLELRRVVRAQVDVRRELEASLERNRLLLGEIDHRVKNSLQQVNSFLQMQAIAAATPGERASLEAAEARVMAVARVHQHLYTQNDLTHVDLDTFLSGLGATLGANASEGVHIQVEAVPLRVAPRHASAMGIIVTELVANALKYAFAPGETGVVRIVVSEPDPGAIAVVVADNGMGFDERDAPRGTGVGMRIVRGLARGMKAALHTETSSQGTRVEVVFSPR